MSQLQKLLLKGKAFEGVTGINEEALAHLKEILLDGETGLEYSPRSIFSGRGTQSLTEMQALRNRRQRLESVLSRLKALYLYSDTGLAEKDYIIENQRITKDLEAVERRMQELTNQGADSLGNGDELIKKASYFVMVEKLMAEGYIDYASSISKLDPNVPRAFVRATIKEIVVSDGKVKSILFKNGVNCVFT